MPMPLLAMPASDFTDTIWPRSSPFVSVIATVAKRLVGSARYASRVMVTPFALVSAAEGKKGLRDPCPARSNRRGGKRGGHCEYSVRALPGRASHREYAAPCCAAPTGQDPRGLPLQAPGHRR